MILDVDLPRISGYEVCRELRDAFGEAVAIMFVSGTRAEAYDRVGGLLIGADDYVVKPFDPDELLVEGAGAPAPRRRPQQRQRISQPGVPDERHARSAADVTRARGARAARARAQPGADRRRAS